MSWKYAENTDGITFYQCNFPPTWSTLQYVCSQPWYCQEPVAARLCRNWWRQARILENNYRTLGHIHCNRIWTALFCIDKQNQKFWYCFNQTQSSNTEFILNCVPVLLTENSRSTSSYNEPHRNVSDCTICYFWYTSDLRNVEPFIPNPKG